MGKFQKIIVELRSEEGLSQMELADALQISQSSIAKWELGKTEPTLVMLVKLAKFFHVTTDYLVGLTDENGNPI